MPAATGPGWTGRAWGNKLRDECPSGPSGCLIIRTAAAFFLPQAKRGRTVAAHLDWQKKAGVYFLFDGRDCIKIGWGRPTERLRRFRTGNVGRLELLAVAVGEPRESEHEYHRKLDVYRVDGEWFSLNPELNAEIERVQRVYSNHGAPPVPRRIASAARGRNKSHSEQPHRHSHG